MSKTEVNLALRSHEDEQLVAIAKELQLSAEEVNQIDEIIRANLERNLRLVENCEELFDPQEKITIEFLASICAIIGTCVGAVIGAYNLGRYAARQCEVRLGLAPAMYKGSRTQIKVAIFGMSFAGGILGSAVALGFDDYFMGV